MTKKKEAPKAPKAPTPVVYDRKAIYIGRRLGNNGKTYQAFLLLPEKKEMLFTGIKRVWLGYTYKCTANSISVKPERTDDEHQSNDTWVAQDALVDEARARERAEEKIKAKSGETMRQAKELFKRLASNMPNYERRALATWLVEQSYR